MSPRTAEHDVPASDYERIGGAPAVRQVVQRFYDRVLADEDLAGFFTGVDMTGLKRHQAQMISHVLGGPVAYEGRELRAAHAGMAIEPGHFAAVVDHLVAALDEAGAPPDVVSRVVTALAGTEQDVVTVAER